MLMTNGRMRFLLYFMLNAWTGQIWFSTSEHAPGEITFTCNNEVV